MSGVYTHLLGPREHRRFLAAALVGRLPMSMLGIATILTVTDTHGSYAVAGAVSAAMLLSQACCAPRLGRLADRVGQARALTFVVPVHVVGLVALVALATGDAPLWTVFVAAVVAGGSFPPIGPLVRNRWRHCLEGPEQVTAAYSLESAVDELVYVLGPLLVVGLALLWGPAAGLLAAAALTAAGATAYAACRTTEPPPRDAPSARLRLRATGVLVVLVLSVAFGVFVGATEVSVLAVTDDADVGWAGGVLISLFSVGSVAAGLAYGSRRWPGAPEGRLLAGTAGILAGAVVLVVAPTPWLLPLGVLVAGCMFAPCLIVTYDLMDGLAEESTMTEAFAWMQAALGLGLAVGTAGAGTLVEEVAPRAGFVVLLLAAAVAVGLAARIGRRAARSAPAEPVAP